MISGDRKDTLYIVGSWAVSIVLLAVILLSKFYLDLAMGTVTMVLWVVAAIAVPIVSTVLVSRTDDRTRGWVLYTVLTMVGFAVYALAMAFWIADGISFGDEDGFNTISTMAIVVCAVWGVYAVINLALFLYNVLGSGASKPKKAKAPKQSKKAKEPSKPDEVNPAVAVADPVEDFQMSLEVVLEDIGSFIENENKGGN